MLQSIYNSYYNENVRNMTLKPGRRYVMAELTLKGGVLWFNKLAIRLLCLRLFITVWPCDHSLNMTIIRHYRLILASI